MDKKVVIKATEHEIVELIQKRFDTSFDSIVADQELGNQEWVTYVEEAHEYDYARLRDAYKLYMCNSYMNVLCKEGVLEAGEYVIDCTW